MRIAIVINASWNIYNFRMGLVRALLDAKHEVYAIAPPDEYSQRLVEAGCQYQPVFLDNKGSHPVKDIYYTLKLYKLYKEIRPDVVLHYTIKPNIYGTVAAKMLSIPVINNVSGLGTVFLHDNLTSKVAHALYKFTFQSPRKIFFQNPDDKRVFVKKKLVNEGITDVLPGSGIDLEQFAPAPFKRNKVFTFLLVARLLFDKGIVEYIEAIKIIKARGFSAKFQLLGFKDRTASGVPDTLLQAWIDAGLVEYLGATDNVKQYISDADCVVLPSYREGTPRTLLEAASMAKPLIASSVPGCTEVVEHTSNGYLCHVKDPVDLAVQMMKMIMLDTRSLQNMGQASRRKVESKFDEKLVINKYMEVLSEIDS